MRNRVKICRENENTCCVRYKYKVFPTNLNLTVQYEKSRSPHVVVPSHMWQVGHASHRNECTRGGGMHRDGRCIGRQHRPAEQKRSAKNLQKICYFQISITSLYTHSKIQLHSFLRILIVGSGRKHYNNKVQFPTRLETQENSRISWWIQSLSLHVRALLRCLLQTECRLEARRLLYIVAVIAKDALPGAGRWGRGPGFLWTFFMNLNLKKLQNCVPSL